MTNMRCLPFALPARLSSWLTLVVLVALTAVGAEKTGLIRNALRGPLLFQPEPEPEPKSKPKPRPRIINGEDVEYLRYPYFSLMYGRSLCGGVLIGPRLVLGAAHCEDAADLFRIGAFEDTSDGQHVDIRDTIVHPDYDVSRMDHDIMIFQLEKTSMHDYITLERDRVDEGTFTVLGFGDTDKGYSLELSDELQEVELEYVDNDTCDDGHGNKGEVKEDMMCAAGRNKDSCIGDSGGPLIKRGSSIDEDKLVGLVSWGRGCAERGVPGVYARISYFYDWIIETVCENFPEDAAPYMGCNPSESDLTDSESGWSDGIIEDSTDSESGWSVAPREDSTDSESDSNWSVVVDRPTSEPTTDRTASPTITPTITPTESPSRPITEVLTPFLPDNQTDAPTILEEALFVGWNAVELKECQGDCDTDEDCVGDLVCFKRNAVLDELPGCSGAELVGQNVDFCIDPSFL